MSESRVRGDGVGVEGFTFPAETGFAGGIGEDPVPGVVEDLPTAGCVVEFDLGGADDFEGADLFQIDALGVESAPVPSGLKCSTSGMSGFMWFECRGFCCWFFWRR